MSNFFSSPSRRVSMRRRYSKMRLVGTSAMAASCLGEVKPAFDADKLVIEPVHSVFKAYEIGAQAHNLRAQAHQLIFYRRHPRCEVMDAVHDGIEFGIEMPEHSQRQVFRFIDHGHPRQPCASSI